MKLLNIGCGKTIHPDWVNYDLTAEVEGVTVCDLTRGIPDPDASADFCYSSHVLEHLNHEEAEGFIAEQYRVLKPGGIIRIAVPDLETITRNYLNALDALRESDQSAWIAYDYSLLEMYDQSTRSTSHGELGLHWDSLKEGALDYEYAMSRHGEELRRFIECKRSNGKSQHRSLIERALLKFGQIKQKIFILAGKLILGERGTNAAQEGLVRTSGVIHKEMYDELRLRRLLEKHGFCSVTRQAGDESYLPDFVRYELDIDSTGVLRKPDSLYMEAIKS